MIIDDLIDARILVELGNRLSFAAVGQALRMPPATVSRRVMRMEARAGLRLFERTTRSVAITQAGALAAEHAARILSEAEAIDVSVASLRETAVGTVRLTTPVIFGQALLGPVAVDFLQDYPLCDLEIDLSDRHADLVDENYDVAIRIGPPADDTLIARSLGLARAALYRRSGLDPVAIDALEGMPLGLLHSGDRSKPSLALVSETGEKRHFTVRPRIVCMNPWLLREAALSSDLVVVLPEMVGAPDVAAGRLMPVAPSWLARRVPIHIAFPSRRLMRPAVRAFIDLAAKRVPPLLNKGITA